jgi:surface antigen
MRAHDLPLLDSLGVVTGKSEGFSFISQERGAYAETGKCAPRAQAVCGIPVAWYNAEGFGNKCKVSADIERLLVGKGVCG